MVTNWANRARDVAVLAALAGGMLLAAHAGAQVTAGHPGVSTYKNAGCITCHKWHGMGGSGYGGTPVNFRENWLDRQQLMEVIACGRPGTAMPYHHKRAYREYDCYEGTLLEDFDPVDRPGPARTTLSVRQIRNVSDFILDHFAGRPNEPERADCELFFGRSRMCRNLEKAMDAAGSEGH